MLAIALDQSAFMLNVPPSSRASSLPQGICVGHCNCVQPPASHGACASTQFPGQPKLPCGSELARDGGGSACIKAGCRAEVQPFHWSKLLTWIGDIQRPVRQQFTDLNHLQDPHRNLSTRAFKVECQVADHGVGGIFPGLGWSRKMLGLILVGWVWL